MIMEPDNRYVPVLAIKSGVTDLNFYKKAFGATIQWRLNNPDGSVHVAALAIDDAVFRVHEEGTKSLSPAKAGGTTVAIGLTADDVYAVVERAVSAGALVLSPVTDYEYGYRQGEIRDPFGHHWIIEKLFNPKALDNFVKERGDI
jgi:PhnB protein